MPNPACPISGTGIRKFTEAPLPGLAAPRRAYKTCRAMRRFIETKYAFDDIAQVNREVDKALPGRDIPGPRSYSGRG